MGINPVVYNNICVADLDRGIAFLTGSYGISCDNNTVIGNGTNPNGFGIRILTSNKDEIISLKNNIVVDIGSSGAGTGYAFSAEAGVNDSNHGYNLAYSCATGGWDGLTKDANSLEADPLFVSATDFHLQPESPCIGTGTPITGIYVDYDGWYRRYPESIGAYARHDSLAAYTGNFLRARNPVRGAVQPVSLPLKD
jgi:hypothetical protein